MKPATEIESEPIEIPRLGYHAYVGINRIVGSGDDGFCPAAPVGCDRPLELRTGPVTTSGSP
jgi:hypothetical protein